MWDGAFFTKSFSDHFKVISTDIDELLDTARVVIEFDADPTKHYIFAIPLDRYKSDKTNLGKEILRQLRNEG